MKIPIIAAASVVIPYIIVDYVSAQDRPGGGEMVSVRLRSGDPGLRSLLENKPQKSKTRPSKIT
jgi:hypothetical protein